MARKRIIYQSQSVKINGTVAMGVQSCSYGLVWIPMREKIMMLRTLQSPLQVV